MLFGWTRPLVGSLALIVVAACLPTSTGGPGGDPAVADPRMADTMTSDGGADLLPADGDSSTFVDRDLDGLDDAYELDMARRYLPFISCHPSEGCGLSGLLVRVRPHPDNGAFLHILYDHLYEHDCGLHGHIGDDEAFAITVDPSLPPPTGIVAMRAIAHQDSLPCQRVSNCGLCSTYAACITQAWQGASWPVVFTSRDKHAGYVDEGFCGLGSCLDACQLVTTPTEPVIVNAGEPDAHLTEDLTASGFITADNGWTEPTLMNFNPWAAGVVFGGAGVIADDLVDPAFLTPICP